MDSCWFVVLGFKTRLRLHLCCCEAEHIMTGFTSLCESFRFYGGLNRRVDHVRWFFNWLTTSRETLVGLDNKTGFVFCFITCGSV